MKKTAVPHTAYDNMEFLLSPDARPVRILTEYLEPLTRLKTHKVNSTILFFGSSHAAPVPKSGPLARYYRDAEELAFLLASWAIKLKPKGKDFVICTGAGPGIMEAANRGARRAGAKTIGMNISIPEPQSANPYISAELSFLFHYFFMRKFWLISPARAIIAFPGGFGTLDEVFETLTLIQTGKISRDDMTVVLYGEEYWRRIVRFETLLEEGAVAPRDLEIFSFASTPREAFRLLKRRLSATLPKR